MKELKRTEKISMRISPAFRMVLDKLRKNNESDADLIHKAVYEYARSSYLGSYINFEILESIRNTDSIKKRKRKR